MAIILDEHELDFLRSFKLQMNTLEKEFAKMKKKIDQNYIQEKRHWKILRLEKQLEYFRCQALWLEEERQSKIILI